MKVVSTKNYISNDVTASEIDLFSDLPEVSDEIKDRIREDVGDYLKEKTIEYVNSARSPVEGESFPALSPMYKAKKVSEGGSASPNLQFTGAMLDDLTYESTDSGIELGYYSANQAAKADGHNNFSGASELPQRRHLPDVGQSFRSEIEKGIDDIIAQHLSDDVPIQVEDIMAIDSKAEMYEYLESFFPGMSRSSIKLAVISNDTLYDLFDDNDLLDLL